ncbi:hypothetical protein RJ639_016939 [Escallonia herrerae]|uniref:Retrotransposon Copia-like N-terminal domain-containing protein n=1 Tax=Escallonia herrerae TaxID=1293975 RepID=A0AA88VB27_9ASTE|nr:hypothetical protein RJ639_016939 [Escallonia herrerae]
MERDGGRRGTRAFEAWIWKYWYIRDWIGECGREAVSFPTELDRHLEMPSLVGIFPKCMGMRLVFIELMASEKAEFLSIKLNGKNYLVWRFYFQYLVEGKVLWGYVDGSEPQPAAIQVKEGEQWKVNNAKVISGILGYVVTSIEIPMRGLYTAKDMWEYLEKVYQQSNFSLKFQVEHDIFIYGQGEKSIQYYYAGFMNL